MYQTCDFLAPRDRTIERRCNVPNVYLEKGVKGKLKNLLNWKNFRWGTEGVYDVPIGGNGGLSLYQHIISNNSNL